MQRCDLSRLCSECYFDIFQNAYIGVMIVDLDSKVISHNGALASILGLDEESKILDEFINYIKPNYRCLFLDSLKKLQNYNQSLNIEIELRAKVGVVWVDIHLSSLKNSPYFVLFCDDITIKKNLEFANREKEYMLIQQSRLAQMGEMLSLITHQWKQPLHTIGLTISYLETAKEFETLSDDCIDKAINAISLQIQNMSNIISTFTNFLKPNKPIEKFNLFNSIQFIFELMLIQLTKKNIVYELNISEDLELFGFKSEFEQVVLNLIANARDAFSDEKKDKKIIVKAYENGEFCEIRFSDNGGGIALNIINHIF